MAKQQSKAPDSGLSAGDAKAQAVIKMQNWIEQVDSAERMQVGTWYEIPEGFKDWCFIRCGMRNSDRAHALAGQLKRMGYQDAPKGVRCSGFENDGADGLYVCVPAEVWNVLKDRKDRARRSVADTITRQMSADLGGGSLGPGSEITVTGKTHTGSERDILEHLRSGT